jgi:hypothetical protein
MANTLTSLFPDLYEAMDVVSRELVGFIPAVSTDHSIDRAAVGQQVRSFVAPSAAATSITPGVTPPNDGDQTIGNVAMTITKAMRVPFRWAGEETRAVNSGAGFGNIKTNQIAQAIRTLTNLMEADLAAQFIQASRATGTAGSTPFASNLSDPAQLRKILSDNGAALGDLHLVIDTTSGAALRTLTQLTKANEAGDTSMLRQGVLLDIHGFQIRESAQVVQAAVVGTVAATTDATGYAVGSTAITLSAAAVALLAGDVIQFAGDSNKYVVAAALSGTGGVLKIAAPGLRQAMSAATKAITVVAAATRNMAFARTAIALATRAPALPEGGDMAVDRQTIVDPRTGMSFEIAMYAQYRQMQYEISAAWGTQVFKPEHLALLLG